jgi:hypothetical protein
MNTDDPFRDLGRSTMEDAGSFAALYMNPPATAYLTDQAAALAAGLTDRLALDAARRLSEIDLQLTDFLDAYGVAEAFRLQKGEVALRKFVRGELATLRRRVFGHRKPGGKRIRDKLYDEYTRFRWEASGDRSNEVPAGFRVDKRGDKDVVIIYARPWVPPAVVARLYAFGRASFPKDVHGPHLKSLHLYLYVTDSRSDDDQTWAETMAAWNDYAEDTGLPNTYTHVSNFHRDYHQVARAVRR